MSRRYRSREGVQTIYKEKDLKVTTTVRVLVTYCGASVSRTVNSTNTLWMVKPENKCHLKDSGCGGYALKQTLRGVYKVLTGEWEVRGADPPTYSSLLSHFISSHSISFSLISIEFSDPFLHFLILSLFFVLFWPFYFTLQFHLRVLFCSSYFNLFFFISDHSSPLAILWQIWYNYRPNTYHLTSVYAQVSSFALSLSQLPVLYAKSLLYYWYSSISIVELVQWHYLLIVSVLAWLE